MAYAIFENDKFTECSGDIVFSPTVYQSAESLSDAQRTEFNVFSIVDERGSLLDGNQWENRWTYRLENGSVVRTWFQEPIPQWARDKMQAQKVEELWQAADAYQTQYISGMAIGLLTIGVLQAKPKALAVQAWSAAMWDLYYSRKDALTYDNKVNTDFSSCGPMPHSVPELRQELGGM